MRIPNRLTTLLGVVCCVSMPAHALQYVGETTTATPAQEASVPAFAPVAEVALYDALINGGGRASILSAANFAATDFGGQDKMQRAAQAGHPKALYAVASMALYRVGDYRDVPAREAVAMLRAVLEAPQQPDERAAGEKAPERYLAAYMLYRLVKEPRPEDEALSKAASSLGGTPQQAISWLRDAADGGVPQAQTALAEMILDESNGLKRNLPQALWLLRQAALAGYGPAQSTYQDTATAWLSLDALLAARKGVVDGDLDAVRELARIHEQGEGVARNATYAADLNAWLDTMD